VGTGIKKIKTGSFVNLQHQAVFTFKKREDKNTKEL